MCSRIHFVQQQMRDAGNKCMYICTTRTEQVAPFNSAECVDWRVQHKEGQALLCFTAVYSLQQHLILVILSEELKLVYVPVDG